MAQNMTGRIFEKNMNMISASVLMIMNGVVVWYKELGAKKCQPATTEKGSIVVR